MFAINPFSSFGSSMYSMLGKLNVFKLLIDREVNVLSLSLNKLPFSINIAFVSAFGL